MDFKLSACQAKHAQQPAQHKGAELQTCKAQAASCAGESAYSMRGLLPFTVPLLGKPRQPIYTELAAAADVHSTSMQRGTMTSWRTEKQLDSPPGPRPDSSPQ